MFQNWDIATYPWPLDNSSFNFVSGCLVLEHLPDLNPYFAEAGRVIAPGGILLVCELHPMKQILGEQLCLKLKPSPGNPGLYVQQLHEYSDGRTHSDTSSSLLQTTNLEQQAAPHQRSVATIQGT